MCGELFAEQPGIGRGREREEWGGEAGREGELRLGRQPFLGAAQLRGIAREKVIHGLGRREPRDRWQNACGICREKEYRAWMSATALGYRVGYEPQRVGRPCVLGERAVFKVQTPT